MSTPFTPVGLYRTERHDYYWNDVHIGPGVTKPIGIIDDGKSDKLVGWAKRITLDALMGNWAEVAAMMERDGEAPTRAWLMGHSTAESDKAKNLGTRVHILAERIERGEQPDISPIEWPFVRAYQQYRREWKPDFRKGRSSLERYVANLRYGYGGTFDFLCHLDLGEGPKLTLGDLKTGKWVHATSRLQLAALGMAEFIGMPNDPRQYPMPPIEQYVILHVRPEKYPSGGYKLINVKVSDQDRKAFLYALGLYRYLQEGLPLGDPIANPSPTIEVDAA